MEVWGWQVEICPEDKLQMMATRYVTNPLISLWTLCGGMYSLTFLLIYTDLSGADIYQGHLVSHNSAEENENSSVTYFWICPLCTNNYKKKVVVIAWDSHYFNVKGLSCMTLYMARAHTYTALTISVNVQICTPGKLVI